MSTKRMPRFSVPLAVRPRVAASRWAIGNGRAVMDYPSLPFASGTTPQTASAGAVSFWGSLQTDRARLAERAHPGAGERSGTWLFGPRGGAGNATKLETFGGVDLDPDRVIPQGLSERKTRRHEPAGYLLRSIFRPTKTRRRGCTKGGGSNSPFPLEPRSSTLDPQMPPMLGFRCKRDKMQKTTFRQGVQRNHAFFCQCDQMSCKRGPSDARGNCTSPTGTVIAFPCPVKSPRKQLKFVIRSLRHDGELLQKTRRQPSGAFGSL
jgi:hypothetical protein